MASIRLAHFSDIHISARSRWGWRDWCSKRLTGWINLHVFGRAQRFAQADEVLAALVNDLAERRPDCLVFSGDASAIGFPEEVARAAFLLRLSDETSGLAVPGNHDYYTPSDEASGLFEKQFAAWQQGERVDGAAYPFARQVGHVWLVAVDSCAGHRWPWDASGIVGAEQRQRLARLLAFLPVGPRILVTHYSVAKADGSPEKQHHGLRDLTEVIEVARAGGVGLWLHGHRHGAYVLDNPKVAPFPVICAGSATEAPRHGYFEYAVDGARLHGVRRVYDPTAQRFQEAESFDLEMKTAAR